MAEKKHVVMFSGGIGSWAAARRVVETHGSGSLVLLFTDTLIEDADLYRFLVDAAENIGGTLVRIAEGRTPWQVFHDKRFLGNSRIDPCSQTLKRAMSDKWLVDNCDPKQTTLYVGIDWTEEHRFVRMRDRKLAQGWVVEAPLCSAPYLSKTDMLQWAAREGLAPPRLYALGFAHNNCGGFCVKAGQGHFARLLQQLPDVYAQHEAEEERLRAHLGKNVAMMTDRRGGGKIPLTMRSLRLRLQIDATDADLFDIGGCGCFVDANSPSATREGKGGVMGIGDQPDIRGEDWHCANCGERSGMYGHAKPEGGFYCEKRQPSKPADPPARRK